MRIAVLADIHGNAPALRAVLGELDRDPADTIVVAGDTVGSAHVRTTLALLVARPEPLRWVAGNCERVAVYDGAIASDDVVGDSLLAPADPEWVTAFFEHSAGRGEHPGG